MFISRTEAYLYAIHTLKALARDGINAALVESAVCEIRMAVENHEKDAEQVAIILVRISERVRKHSTRERLLATAEQIRHFKDERNALQKYENPLARRIESQIHITMLQNPTEAMMETVGFLSQKIILAIESVHSSDPKFGLQGPSNKFLLPSLKPSELGFGGFDVQPSREQIINILQANRPEDLACIMQIHFKFAQNVFRYYTFEGLAPVRPPIGKLREILRTTRFREHPEKFFEVIEPETASWIPDTLMYQSGLYKERGRLGIINVKSEADYKIQMGLMREEGGLFNEGIPCSSPGWAPDAKLQAPDLEAPCTRDLFENDAVYVSGPSGMTSLFLGQMECLANFSSLAEKQHYLAAITAYMVSGGFHSLHEVIGPAEYALGLVPGYEVSVPVAERLASPPNYHVFYAQLMSHDVQFQSVYQRAWQQIEHFFSSRYLPEEGMGPMPAFNPKTTVEQGIREFLDLKNRGNLIENLTFFRASPSQLRAQNYLQLLAQSQSAFESSLITCALFATSHGRELQRFIAKKFGFTDIDCAYNFFNDHVKYILGSEIYPHKPDSEKALSALIRYKLIPELNAITRKRVELDPDSIYSETLRMIKSIAAGKFDEHFSPPHLQNNRSQ